MLMIMGSGLSLLFLAGLVVVSFYTIKSSFSFLFVGTPTNWWMMTTKLKLVPSFAMSSCNSFKKEKDHYGLFLLTKWRKLTYFENHAQKYNSFFIHSVILQYQIDYKIDNTHIKSNRSNDLTQNWYIICNNHRSNVD